MKVLLKAVRSPEDLTSVLEFCEMEGILVTHNGHEMYSGDIRFKGNRGIINWGGYGSSFTIGKNLFNYFKLEYPGNNLPRPKTFTRVKMVISGKLKDLEAGELTKRIEKLGGVVSQTIDDSVNLLVTGDKPDAKLVKEAKEQGRVLILDEQRFSELLPAKRKVTARRKSAPRKPIPKSLDKSVLSNLKKMFVARDKERIDMGLELLRSLDDADICSYFLDGVSYVDGHGGHLIPNTTFKGSGPAQPYLNYALTGIIAYAPAACEAANHLKEAITNLSMELVCADQLKAFTNLKSLDLSNSDTAGLIAERSREDIETLDGLAPLNKLSHIEITNCCSLSSLKGLLNKSLDNTSLDLRFFKNLENLEGLQSMHQLKEITLGDCSKLKNIDALKDLTHLENIYFNCLSEDERKRGVTIYNPSVSIGYIGMASRGIPYMESLKNLNGISNLHQLQKLEVSGKSLTDISALKGLKMLKGLTITSDSLQSVKGLESLPKLEVLYINCPSVTSLAELKALPLLKELTIHCESLTDLKWIKRFPSLQKLNLNCDSIKDIAPLKALSQLISLDLDCKLITDFNGLNGLKKLENLVFVRCTGLTSLNGIPNPELLKNGLDLSKCPSIRDISIIKTLTELPTVSLHGSSMINNTEELKNITIHELSVEKPSIKLLNAISPLNVNNLELVDPDLPSFEGLKPFESVKNLSVHMRAYDVAGISSTKGIEAFSTLENLNLGNKFEWSGPDDDHGACKNLSDLKGFEKLLALKEVNLLGCSSIKNVGVLAELPNLSKINMDGCSDADPLPRPKIMEYRQQVEKYQHKLLKALGKEVPKASKAPKKDKSPIDKKTLSKIKKLLQTRDYSVIDTGIELARDLDNPVLFEELLQRCLINEDGAIVSNKIFTGTGPAQPYLNYAILSLIAYAPEDAALDQSMKCTTITKLDLQSLSSGWEWLGENPMNALPLEKFINLSELHLEGLYSLQSIDSIAKLKNLTVLNISACKAIKDIDAINGLVQLTDLNLSNCYNNMGAGKSLENVDGLTKLTSLTSLNLNSCATLANIDGIGSLSNLSTLDISSCSSITNVDGLPKNTEITELDLSGCDKLQNLNGLANLSNLKILDLSYCKALTNIDGLANCPKVDTIMLNNCESLKNVNGLAGLTKISSLNFGYCNALENIDGISKLTNLTTLNFYQCESLQNLDALAKLTNISDSIDLRYCKSLQQIDGLANCTKITFVDLEGCESLQNIDGLASLSDLENLRLKNCKSLQHVDGLSQLKNISFDKTGYGESPFPDEGCCVLGNESDGWEPEYLLSSLQNVNGLIDLPHVITLELCNTNLKSLPEGLGQIKSLVNLDLSNNNFKSLPKGFENIQNITHLHLKSCPSLENLSGIEKATSIKNLIIKDCPLLKDVSALDKLTVESLKMRGCWIKKADLPGALQAIVDTSH